MAQAPDFRSSEASSLGAISDFRNLAYFLTSRPITRRANRPGEPREWNEKSNSEGSPILSPAYSGAALNT